MFDGGDSTGAIGASNDDCASHGELLADVSNVGSCEYKDLYLRRRIS